MKHIEKVDTIYNLLPPVPYQVYRIKIGGGRMYYTMINDIPSFYISLTTLTRATLPTSEILVKWIADMGYDNAKRYMKERAEYGTLMHYAYGEFVMKKYFDFDTAPEFIKDAIAKGVVDGKYYSDEWEEELVKDIASFAQFCYEKKVEPLAIELVMVSKDGYGTLVDLVCKMHEEIEGLDHDNPYKSGKRKGQPREIKIKKTITALINFKSSKKGFHEEHEIQLEFEKRLFQENYPDIKIDAIYNFAPADWRGKPTYKLKDQSDSLDAEKADLLLGLARIELMKRIPNKMSLESVVKYGHSPVVVEQSVVDYIINKHRQMAIAQNAI